MSTASECQTQECNSIYRIEWIYGFDKLIIWFIIDLKGMLENELWNMNISMVKL